MASTLRPRAKPTQRLNIELAPPKIGVDAGTPACHIRSERAQETVADAPQAAVGAVADNSLPDETGT